MANLGFHTVYKLLNDRPGVVCERAFLPEGGPDEEPRSEESHRRLTDFDVIAFSISFEMDYVNALDVLRRAGLPLKTADRTNARMPLVIAGGVAFAMNPEPMADFLDAVLIGEAEVLLDGFISTYVQHREAGSPKADVLRALAQVPGCYVPSLYDIEYGEKWEARRTPKDGAPMKVKRMWIESLKGLATSRAIDSPDSHFGDLYLTEVSRGCLWGCRFCAAGFILRPYREVDQETLNAEVAKGRALGRRIGLVGADVSDYSQLAPLTDNICGLGGSFSPSALRVPALSDDLLAKMSSTGERTVTLAPEAATERLRSVINKDFTDADIIAAARRAAASGMIDVKMYFIIGLPTETDEDVLAMVTLAQQVREAMLETGRKRGQAGKFIMSVNPFVPKPWTPFQWAAFRDERETKGKLKLLHEAARKMGNVQVNAEAPRDSYLQTLLSRGDRRVAEFLEVAVRAGGDYRQALRDWTPAGPDAAWYVERHIHLDEQLPWDFIEHGFEKKFLIREYHRGVAAKITPECHLETCRACGMDCADYTVEERKVTGDPKAKSPFRSRPLPVLQA